MWELRSRDRRCSWIPQTARQGTLTAAAYSTRRKTQAVIRLLRGEDIDALSGELGVTAASVSGWRDHFLAALKTRQPDACDEEVMRVKAKIGDITMENELLREESMKLK